ncbi:MAG: hypothetical protein LBR85_05570 [Oscillospiraceae bacterium]|nr:hypothetical protein [Oscillospiraceae bacterium]
MFWLRSVCSVSLTSKMYFNFGLVCLSSISAMPFAPRRTHRLNFSFQSVMGAQAEASGR